MATLTVILQWRPEAEKELRENGFEKKEVWVRKDQHAQNVVVARDAVLNLQTKPLLFSVSTVMWGTVPATPL